MSYYMQSSYTSTWHRTISLCILIMIIQQKQVGHGVQGAWVGSSEAPTLQGNSLVLGSPVQTSAVLWCLQQLPSLPVLPDSF